MAKKRSLAELPKAKHPGVSTVERMSAKQQSRFYEIVDEYIKLRDMGDPRTVKVTIGFIYEECGVKISECTFRREMQKRG